MTGSIHRAIDVTDHRREKQKAFNKQHGITPTTVIKAVADIMEGAYSPYKGKAREFAKVAEETIEYASMSAEQLRKKLKQMEDQMYRHAQNLEFEEAARLRDEIQHIQNTAFGAEAV